MANSSAAQYQYTLTADDQATLDQWVPKLVAQMHKMPALADINTDQQDKSMQVGIESTATPPREWA
ncbi:hypothetical protein [Paraburkholderia sp. BL6669N2]|uniref:hypothetical protein n=1 Tax=Paraburkholderia sp. BL6669N2 TaxID=1938807 RepID=UPI002162B90E|nr:hypothetical protein [Paraburkholderia sp. BL6669N2]